MNTSEMREKSVDDLQKELLALRKEQLSLRMQKGAGESAPKPHQHQHVRRDIARIKTILTERKEKA